jgi:hypothetical protein
LRITASRLRDLVLEEVERSKSTNRHELIARCLAYAKVLEKIVPYEDYKLVGVGVPASAPEVKTGETVREFTLTVFEGGRKVIRDAEVPALPCAGHATLDDAELIDE